MPNLRGRTDRKNHERGQERSGSANDVESNDEFDFGSTEEAEGSNRIKKLKPSDQGGDEAKKGKKAKTWLDVVKGLKIEYELETTNSDKSRDKLEIVDSVWMFDSETPNQLRAKRKKGQQKRRQHRDNKEAGKGRTSIQAD